MLRYEIQRDRTPKTCFPVGFDYTDMDEISTVGSEWARFIDVATGTIYDCAEYYKRSRIESCDDYIHGED